MIQNEGYIEFDMKTLFFYILRRWKIFVVFGLIIAVLLGSYMAYSEHKTTLAVDPEDSYWAEYLQYHEQLALYEERIATTQKKIDLQQDYLDNSVLMNTDHRNVYIAKATYYVDSGYQIIPDFNYQDPDKTYTLVWYLCDSLKNYTVYEEVGAEIGIDAKYLMELVEVTIANSDILSIAVSHSSQQVAQRIMTTMQDKLQEIHLQLNASVEEHTITKMTDTCGVYINEDLKASQQAARDELLELQDDLLLYKLDLYNLKEGPTPDELNIVKSFVKGFIVGGMLGVILVVFFLFLKSILTNCTHSSAQLASIFHVGVLGEFICSTNKLSPVSRMLNRMEGYLSENSNDNYDFLAESIRHHLNGSRNIMICCDLDSNISRTLADSLNDLCPDLHFFPAGSLLRQAGALHQLSECDSVLMVAVRDRSRNAVIRKMLSLIKSYNKEVIGFVIAY